MIDNIVSNSPHLQVFANNTSTYVNTHAGSQGVGNMRYNTSTQRMEVYDGSIWMQINMGTANVGLSSGANSAIDWALRKMSEEAELKGRMEKHPGLKQAYEQFQTMEILTRQQETTYDHGVQASA